MLAVLPASAKDKKTTAQQPAPVPTMDNVLTE